MNIVSLRNILLFLYKKDCMAHRKLRFMIHKHHATHLHYDLRIEIKEKLKSWALRAIPLKASEPLLAIKVADHPMWYRHFEGVIPEGQYGAGPVMVWDKGLYTSFMKDHTGKLIPVEKCLEHGFLLLWLEGHKLKGGYILVRISKKQRWLFIKMADAYARRRNQMPAGWGSSIKSGKTLPQILKKGLKKAAQEIFT